MPAWPTSTPKGRNRTPKQSKDQDGGRKANKRASEMHFVLH